MKIIIDTEKKIVTIDQEITSDTIIQMLDILEDDVPYYKIESNTEEIGYNSLLKSLMNGYPKFIISVPTVYRHFMINSDIE